MTGLILLNKPEGLTSQSAVTRVKRLLGVRKAGHTGTLDPMATGVLPILLGRATGASDFLLTAEKHYLATLTLGLTTDTEDSSGNILTTSNDIPEEAAVLSAIEAMHGEILQTPPMFSALKVGGQKLVDLARKGVVVAREPRKITIFNITAKRLDQRRYTLDVACSKGTYIRTLCADIGQSLGCGGIMSSLCRAEAGGFRLDQAVTLERLENTPTEERNAFVLPVSSVFASWDTVVLPPFFARLAHDGCEIYQHKIHTAFPLGAKVALYDESGFFAVGEVRDFENGQAIKPIRQLAEL